MALLYIIVNLKPTLGLKSLKSQLNFDESTLKFRHGFCDVTYIFGYRSAQKRLNLIHRKLVEFFLDKYGGIVKLLNRLPWS